MLIEKLNINEYFYDYLIENKIIFSSCLILLFTYPLQKVVLPKYYGKVISNLGDSSKKKFIENAKMLLIVYASIQFLHSIFQKIQGLLIPKFSEFALKRLFTSLLKNDNEDFENMKVGEILAKITKLPHLIYRYLDILKSVVFSQIIVLGTCIFHYYNVSLKLLLAFILVVFGVFCLQIITFKLTMTLETKREEEQDKIYQHFQDVLNNMISVLICKGEKHEKDKLTSIFSEFTKIFKKVLNVNFIMRVIFSLFNIFSFCLLNYILYKDYLSKNITKEQFSTTFIITYSVLQLFNDGAYSVRLFVDMTSQIKDMEDFFNYKIFKSSTIKDETKKFVNGDIVFENVNYKYKKDGEEHHALKNINITIKKNENVALVGHIGSGKSTMVKCLLKLNKVNSGRVTIGGIDINNLSKDELYSNVFYIPQKPKLLNRTLYENITYGLNVKDKDKKEMLQKINNIMEFMKLDQVTKNTFKDKMDHTIGVDGSKISGGQRQIVWIIRALLRDMSIIIMDEPTSSLDKTNKQKIYNIIEEIGINKTIIIISHDDVSIGYRKVLMKNGNVENNTSMI
tara:strand:- start:2419 stop:4119 length:1701 start_codon:yes stop_codon:yes gene_type:complete